MKVRVRAFASFREVLGESVILDLPKESTTLGLLERLGNRSPEANNVLFDAKGELRRHVIIMVNKKRQNRAEIISRPLEEGDEVAVYPPVAGG
jgi:molybdopterin synthase sulfur carrier subunit